MVCKISKFLMNDVTYTIWHKLLLCLLDNYCYGQVYAKHLSFYLSHCGKTFCNCGSFEFPTVSLKSDMNKTFVLLRKHDNWFKFRQHLNTLNSYLGTLSVCISYFTIVQTIFFRWNQIKLDTLVWIGKKIKPSL